MKIRGLVLAAGIVLGAGSASLAQFSAGAAGPFNSVGAQGNPLNGVFSYNYAGPSFTTGMITLTGTATSGDINSYLSELRYRVTAPGGAALSSGAVASGNAWTGDFAVNNSQSFSGLGVGGPGVWTFEFFEDFNDGGDSIDAIWSNINFSIAAYVPPVAPPSIFVGDYAPGTSFDIDTFGSGFDTELGLYNSNGALLANNDDSGGLQSRLQPGALGDGVYYIAVGGYNTTFGPDFGVLGGASSGSYMLNINGTMVASAEMPANGVAWYSFNVPAPGAAALLGLGGLVAARRRR